MVYATKSGTGSKRVLLIAHMDTVYAKGMVAKQPFRIDGDRVYGLGIADDKQGVALILHLVDLLARNGQADHAQLGVLINGDEEIGSPGSAALLTQLGSAYDAVLSFEGGGSAAANGADMVRLDTSSIAIVEKKVTGKASHAGTAPQAGRNALYELAHQMLKSRHFGDPAKGLQINWTVANAASRALAEHAVRVYGGLGLPLDIRDRATGGGTDAAFAGLRPPGGVLESFGLRGFGAHSNDNEYVLVSKIAPRLYLATRMVLDAGSGRVRW